MGCAIDGLKDVDTDYDVFVYILIALFSGDGTM